MTTKGQLAVNPTDAGGGVREQLVAKGNLPRTSAPRPAEALTLRLPSRPSGLALDAEGKPTSPCWPQSHAREGDPPLYRRSRPGGALPYDHRSGARGPPQEAERRCV